MKPKFAPNENKEQLPVRDAFPEHLDVANASVSPLRDVLTRKEERMRALEASLPEDPRSRELYEVTLAAVDARRTLAERITG